MSSTSKNLVIVRSVVDQGLTTAQADAKFGVSRQWVHQLVQRYRTGGAAHRGKQVLMLIHNEHVTTSEAATSEILTKHVLDAAKDYQAPTWRKPLSQ